jgi:uncharacterized protein YjiS (DUF1127 family)
MFKTRSGRDRPLPSRDGTNCGVAQKARHVRVHRSRVENRIDISVLPDLTDQQLKDLGIPGQVENAADEPRSRQRRGCRNGLRHPW